MYQVISTRKANSSDTASILSVHQKAFGRDEEANLVEAIIQSDHFIEQLSIVGSVDEEVCGHALFSRVMIEDIESDRILALAPVAVLPEYQGQSMGTKIIKEGIKIADKLGYSLITVLGDPQYYRRFNFKTGRDFAVISPFEVEEEYYMVLPLEKYDTNHKGKVVYPKAFGLP